MDFQYKGFTIVVRLYPKNGISMYVDRLPDPSKSQPGRSDHYLFKSLEGDV